MTVTLAAALQTNEFVYVAYSADAFATAGNSGVLAVTSSASNVYTFTMPAFVNGTVVAFYPFTSGSDEFLFCFCRCSTNSVQNFRSLA